MEIVPDIDATDFKDCVQKRYGNSTHFCGLISLFSVMAKDGIKKIMVQIDSLAAVDLPA